MSVKTPGGLTKREIITNTVLQGDTWGSLLASVDAVAKDVEKAALGYIYKENMQVCMLELVDEEIIISYENIYNGNILNQRKVLIRFEANMKIRNDMKSSKVPCEKIIDPLNCYQSSNG